MYHFFAVLLLSCLSSLASGPTNPGKDARKGQFVKAGNFNVYTEVQGKGYPLLLLHGGYLDHRMWEEQVRYFQSSYQVITIDLPGHSKTSGVDTGLKVEDVIRTVLDSLKIQKMDLAGLSLGAMCALDFVLAYPEKVNRLVLISPGFWQHVLEIDSVSKRVFALSDSIQLTNDRTRIARNFMDTWCVGPFRTENQVNVAVRSYVYQTALQNLTRRQPTWPTFDRDHSAANLMEIKCPVLLLEGDKDVPHIRETVSYLYGHITGAKRYTVKDAAHMLNMEQPKEFNQKVREFLSQ